MMLLGSRPCRHLHVDGLNKVLVSFSASVGFKKAVCHGVAKSLPLARAALVQRPNVTPSQPSLKWPNLVFVH